MAEEDLDAVAVISESREEQSDSKDAFSNGIQNPGFVSFASTQMNEVGAEVPPNDVGRFRNTIQNIGRAKSTELITYTWNGINVWTSPEGESTSKFSFLKKKASTKSKQLLKNVSGVVRAGELLAIMGASGAGKTTLLNILTFRNTGKLKVSGDRAVNGVSVGPDSLTAVSAYVQQDDLFIGTLTVREHLVFQALVRMHEHIPYAQRLLRVEEVIQELGLTKCSNTKIGMPGRVKGISGGEMKRLAFASEVLTDPPLMFCDEPTSGLDSYMAQNVVSVLKSLALKGKTIVCTIHQPSSQVYEMFDRILLLAEGRVAFLGDTQNTVQFLSTQGFECPKNYNPSDFFIQTLAIQPGNEDISRQNVEKICDSFETSPEGIELRNFLGTKNVDVESAEYLKVEAASKKRSPYKASWFAQFRAVLWRSWISYLKDPFVLRIRMVQTVIMALLIGFIYLGQEFNQSGVQNINGVLFLILANMTFVNAFGVVDVFCLELPVFLREHWNGMYRTDVYFISKMLAELPFYILLPVVFTSITYFMIGLYSSFEAFIWTAVILTLIANTAASFGYLMSCIASSVTMALAIAPAVIIPFMIFGGLFLNSGSVPVYLIWIKYTSWFFYGNEALVVSQWKDVEYIECDRSNFTCPPNGQAVIANLDFNQDNFPLDIAALTALLVAYRILAFVALFLRTIRKV